MQRRSGSGQPVKGLIEKEFGDLPLKALLDSEIRGEFKRWRRQNFKWN
jgi:hypothetical protein